jgi:hypothetical protein
MISDEEKKARRRAYQSTAGSLRIEGLELPPEDVAVYERLINGELESDDILQALLFRANSKQELPLADAVEMILTAKKLPEKYMGYLTLDLLWVWAEIRSPQGTQADKETIVAMRDMLREFKLGIHSITEEG